MRNTIIILVTILLGSCLNVKKNPASKNHKLHPNILFILADDLGYHDLSCTGSRLYETPNIDKIASEGMVFTQGYANCQVCSPSRASIMSGKYTARHGITDWIGAETGEDWRNKGRNNQLLPPDYIHQLPHEYITLPEAMKEAGYKTFFAGKWHLGDRGSWPEDHGFDINIGGWDAGSPVGGYFSPFDNPNLPNREDGENLSMRLAKETVHFLEGNNPNKTGKPVFAFLSFYAVHGPNQTTQKKWDKYRDKVERMGIVETGFKMGHFFPIRQVQDNPVYAGLVETMDDAVGKVLNALEELGLSKNTIVIFTSDNGGVAAGDSYSTSNLPLRAGKGYQFEGGIREPYFIKVPGVTSGQRNNTPVIGSDLYPTILDLAGLELRPTEHTDGISLVPLLKGESSPERPLIWHYPHYGNQGGEPSSIIRLGDWKLIHYYEDGHNELYNLHNDPGERQDVSGTHHMIVVDLNKRLFSYLYEVGAKFPKKDPEYNKKAANAYNEKIANELLPKLEQQRHNILSKDYKPNNDWWGSMVTKD